MEVRLNDYLDIVCPHYPEGEVPLLDAERYVLYMVEREDYESCKPQSYDQMRWECGHPFAPHAPEKFSEKFQRFTPFTLGKEFRQGESYYYICECHQFLSRLVRLCASLRNGGINNNGIFESAPASLNTCEANVTHVGWCSLLMCATRRAKLQLMFYNTVVSQIVSCRRRLHLIVTM